jgi:hypothetical protein
MMKLTLLPLLLIYGCLPARGEPPKPIELSTYTGTKDGMELKVQIPKEAVPPSGAIFEITLRNLGRETVDVREYFSFPECMISIVSSQGEPCQMTPEGLSVLGPERFVRSAIGHPKIGPSESKAWRLPLANYFELNRNNYIATLTLRSALGNGQKFELKGIAFSVK